jgi:uncharacterized protein YegL
MEWLTPLTGLYAAAATVPLLLLLYLLKLKRREHIISSTLLWKRAVQDLQVNAPFQKIRRNILLLLQLLMLVAILLALAGPILSLTSGPGRRFVLLIDRSASMSSADVEPTRLDDAKKQAVKFIDSLRSKAFFSLKDASDRVMVIAFDDHAKVMCNFTSDKHQLRSAVEAITGGDGGSSLAEAVTVARAFAQSPGTEANNRSAENPAQLVLFSDGRIRDTEQIVVGSDELVFNCIGESQQNTAVTAMQARRSYENPDEIDVFATIANYGTEQVSCDVQLSINNNVRAIKRVIIPAQKADDGPGTSRPGKVSVDLSLSYTGAGVLEVRQLQSDVLGCDDAAWSILSPPKRLTVLLVTKGNMVLESALQACPLAKLELCSPDEFDAMDTGALSVEQPYDVIVLDNYVPAKLPRCRYLVFGHPPNGIDVTVGEQLENQVIVDWRPRHPVLKYVNLMNVFCAKCYRMALPRDGEVLAEFNETPALALIRRHGSIFLLAGFDVLETNWPFEPSFVLFCYNAAAFLGVQAGLEQRAELEVGEPIIVEGLAPDTVGAISGPGLSGSEIKANPAGSIRLPSTDKVGVYSLAVADQPLRFFAVNLLDLDESNIEPMREIVLSGQSVQAQESPVGRSNLPVWPFLVGIALILACLEWIVYNSKVRI